VIAPIDTGAVQAVLLACLIPVSALARVQGLELASSTNYPLSSLARTLGCAFARIEGSWQAVGSIFSYCDQNLDQLKAGVSDVCVTFMSRRLASASFGDHLKYIDVITADSEGNLVDCSLINLAEHERQRTAPMPTEYLK
jgi:hypothetical protein